MKTLLKTTGLVLLLTGSLSASAEAMVAHPPHPPATQVLSSIVSSTENLQSQLEQAKMQKEQAATQIYGATLQSMQQGISQTQQLTDSLRENMDTISSEMAQMVQGTKV